MKMPYLLKETTTIWCFINLSERPNFYLSSILRNCWQRPV
jgi:hypothetical protein